eukprot:gene11000-12818_t
MESRERAISDAAGGVCENNVAVDESWQVRASRSPIYFAQVREDPRLDQYIFDTYFGPEAHINMAMVASGGDTAAFLLRDPRLKKLDLVDISKPQLSISQLKIALLSQTTERRLQLLGHSPMDSSERRQAVEELLVSQFPRVNISEDFEGNDLGAGIDRNGRYELFFHALKVRLSGAADEIEDLFALDSVEEQSRRISSDTELGQELDAAFDDILDVHNYFVVFGERATSNKGKDFSKGFLHKLRKYLSHHLASESPFVSQILRASFYKDHYYEWYSNPVVPRGPAAEVGFHQKGMEEYLRDATDLDVVHLSNITDWFTPDQCIAALRLAYQALRPSGIVFLRQINTHFDIFNVKVGFVWDESASQDLIYNDRSFFYRIAAIGRKI